LAKPSVSPGSAGAIQAEALRSHTSPSEPVFSAGVKGYQKASFDEQSRVAVLLRDTSTARAALLDSACYQMRRRFR
jgi:hypothetical protein